MQLVKLLCVILCIWTTDVSAVNIGVMIVATNKYIRWVQPLIESAEKYFCPEHTKTYFVYTDMPLEPAPHIMVVYREHVGWPRATLLRCEAYLQSADIWADMDYVFALDADMLFVAPVGDEVLGERVATQSPGFVGRRGTYETNRRSTAYVASHEGTCYFAGGVHGGTREEFLKLVTYMVDAIYKDFEWNYIAVWHDESHLNRYFIDNPPTVILSPSYCYPESWRLPYVKRLLALDKNHSEYQR